MEQEVKFSVIIPNWNGQKLLEKNLPIVIEASGAAEIIVVDDNSPDQSNLFLKANFPRVKVISHRKNLGFGAACNTGVAAAKGHLVALLNLDVVPEKGFLEKVKDHFHSPEVFAVSFNEPQNSWARISWRNGFFEHELGERTDKTHISGWANGGSALFRKSMWLKLGGFDELFRPFYWEDIDLSYRAWKRGWKILWEPKAVVHHQHESIIGKHFSRNFIDFVSQRNQLLFIWRNITDEKMFAEHCRNLLVRSVHLGFWRPFLGSLMKINQVLPRRKIEKEEQEVTDSEIFNFFKQE